MDFLRLKYPDWMDDAECVGPDVEDVFFHADNAGDHMPGPELGKIKTEGNRRDIYAKTRYCSMCPVRRECAVEGWDQEYGIYGGWTPVERRQMDAGTFRPTPVRTPRSSRRDDAVAYIRQGLSVEDTAIKMEVNDQVVINHLREFWAVLITESYIPPTA